MTSLKSFRFGFEPLAGALPGEVEGVRQIFDALREALLLCPDSARVAWSGGLDSSLLLALGQHSAVSLDYDFGPAILGERVVRESLDFAAGREVLDVSVTEGQARGELRNFLKDSRGKLLSPFAFAFYLLAKAAAVSGASDLILGDGADEIFGGQERCVEYLRLYSEEDLESLTFGKCRYAKVRDLFSSEWRLSRGILKEYRALAAHFGVSLHFPFLSRDIVGQRARFHGVGLIDKEVLKVAAEEILPFWAVHRPKVGLNFPAAELVPDQRFSLPGVDDEVIARWLSQDKRKVWPLYLSRLRRAT